MLRVLLSKKRLWSALSLPLVFLAIEFFDELHYGITGAALPAMRADLALSYAQVGLLLGLPHIIGTLIEPALMLLGDTPLRKRLVVGGGLVIILSLGLIAAARSFPLFLLAFVLSFPASGAFVTLAQATLMDLNPGRESHMMARWTAAGSVGNLLGPLLVAGGLALALGWRWVFYALAGLALILVLAVLVHKFPAHPAHEDPPEGSFSLRLLMNSLRAAVRNRDLLRWVLLLDLSDLLLDIFTGYTALYFTDVAGATPAQASLFLTVLMLAGLAADLLLIPLLEHVPGRWLVRASAALAIPVYAAWLLAPWLPVKVILLVLIRFSTLGWYPVLQGEAYASAPGRSGAVMAITSLAGILSGGLTWLVGWTAGAAGLPAAMWLLLLGPISLVLFVPPHPAGSEALVKVEREE